MLVDTMLRACRVALPQGTARWVVHSRAAAVQAHGPVCLRATTTSRLPHSGMVSAHGARSCHSSATPPAVEARSACSNAVAAEPAAAPAATPVATRALSLLGLSYDRLQSVLVSLGYPSYRAAQVFQAVHQQLHADVSSLSTLSRADRLSLAAQLDCAPGSLAKELVSTDGTRKWLVQPPNGGTSAVEMVYIPDAGAEDEDDVDMDRSPRTASRSPRASRVPARHLAGASVEDVLAGRAGGVHKRRRATLCVSSQAGCSLACTFCHTGTQALSRNLSAADIVSQVWLARRRVREMQEREPALPHLSNIVFMGQGEPGFNWRAVSTAIQILTDARGFGMSPRRITVSTAGVAPIIPRIARETPGVRLAISLHAPTDELRSRIMNVNTMYPIATLMAACREYVQIRLAAVQEAKGGAAPALDSDAVSQLAHERVSDAHNSARRVRITFEYVMLAGVNDTPGHALELSKLLLAHLPRSAVHINLIAFNAWPGSEYRGSSPDVIARFQGALYRSGLRAHIRRSRGGDILGACGQLKSAAESKAAASRRASTVSKPAPEA